MSDIYPECLIFIDGGLLQLLLDAAVCGVDAPPIMGRQCSAADFCDEASFENARVRDEFHATVAVDRSGSFPFSDLSGV